MLKKVLSLILCTILVVSMAGCAAAENQRTKVTIWHMLSGVGAEAFDQIVADFNASQDQYEAVAEFQGSWYDNFAKFKATPKEDLPDLYQIVVECMGWLAESDMIIPVQKFIDRDGFNVSGMQENIRALYTLNDTLYCMPLSVTMLALNYNAEVLEAAGIDPSTLKTVADVDAAAKKITDAGLCKKGFSLINDSWQIEEYISMSGEKLVDHDNGRSGRATKCLMNEGTAALDIFTTFHDALTKDYNMAPTTGLSTTDLGNAFFQGDLAMVIFSSQWIAKQKDAIGDRFTLGQVAAPSIDGSASGTFSPGGNSMWIVDKGNEELSEGAWAFLQYMWQPEVMGYYAAYTNYTPVSEEAYNSEVYKAHRQENPFVENIWQELVDCDPQNVGAVFGVYYEFRNTVQNAFARMMMDESYTPSDAVEEIVATTNENIELYNEANPL